MAHGHEVIPLDVRTHPPLHADAAHPAITEAVGLFAQAEGAVIGIPPVCKAAHTGLLQSLLDVLPQDALADKTVLPLVTGTTAHILALDYALLAHPPRSCGPDGWRQQGGRTAGSRAALPRCQWSWTRASGRQSRASRAVSTTAMSDARSDWMDPMTRRPCIVMIR